MSRTLLVLALAAFALTVAARLIPHLPNATPVAALALVGGAYLGKRWALALPLAALLLSDLIIGFYDWRIMASVYASFTIVGALQWLHQKGLAPRTLALTLLAGPFSFFLITNAAVWLFSPWYEKSLAGLLYAYELGIPFLRNMLVGDVFYAAIGIAVFESVRLLARSPAPPSLQRLSGKPASIYIENGAGHVARFL